jgi:hypothetical protein
MHPYMSQSLAAERIRDMLTEAAEADRARQARCHRQAGASGLVSRASARLIHAIGHATGLA